MAVRKPRPAKPIDEQAVRELELYIDNTQSIYRRKLEFEKSAARKICRGKYDPAKAPKLFRYLADEGARMYREEFAGYESGALFSTSDRDAVARSLARDFESRVNDYRAGSSNDLAPEVASILNAKNCKR